MDNREKDIRENWFKDHVGIYRNWTPNTHEDIFPQKIESLSWRKKSNSSVYFVNYFCDGRFLYVSGDVGEAIFEWGGHVTLKQIARFDLHYFASKCRASENGPGYKIWDEEVAKNTLQQYFEEEAKEDYESDDDDARRYREKKMLYISENGSYNDPLYSQFDWNVFLEEKGYELFGDSYYEWGDIGKDVDIRCESYLIGLKMAEEKKMLESVS